MERHIPRPGEKYMDMKKRPYQILCMANYTKTGEKMVVYQALYGEFECFVRPLGMFMGEVDHKKYPEISQKYRFELADVKKKEEPLDIKPGEKQDVQRQIDITVEEQANPTLLQFLDADTLEEKYQVIKSLSGTITNRLIDDFAVTLDLVIPDGDVDIRYQQLLSSVRTMQKFESTRLRTR